MACAEAGAIVTVKILVKKNKIPPVRVGLKNFQSPCHRPPAIFSSKENVYEAP
jgi:hypothetical protein